MWTLFLRVLILFMLASAFQVYARQAPYRIGILMWHEVKHDMQAIEGFKEGLEFSGIPYLVDLKNAHESKREGVEILSRWKQQKIDLVLTVGTSATLLAQTQLSDIPVVFTAVTSPVTSGIVKSWQKPGKNATGTSNWVKPRDKLKQFKNAMPDLNKLGVIYNLQNPVSVAEVEEARPVISELGINLLTATITEADQIESTLEGLISQGIDALWVPIEKIVYSNMDRVGSISIPARLPVFSSTSRGVEATASGKSAGLVGITVDYRKLGRRSVYHVIDILTRGTNPGDIPVDTLPPFVISNINNADSINYKIPPSFLARSDYIISGYDNQKIVVSGTGDSQKLLKKMAHALSQKHRNSIIQIPDSIGSTGGIREVAAGRIELARSARPLHANEIKKGLSSKIFAYSPIVFAVNPSVSGIDNLDTSEILDIYSGKIVNWLEVGSVDHRIYAITRESGDSSLKILQQNLEGFKDISTESSKTIYSTPDTAAAIKKHPFTIGYVPLSEIMDSDLRVLKIDGVFPTVENVRNGSYKLLTQLSIVYKTEPSGLARSFLDFLFSEEGKEIILNFGAIPAGP
jgi:phosphate transport system substrate-binding protein